jgi:hypothetical protein
MDEVAVETKMNLQDSEWKRRFVSDVFHSLSQPLTALQCSLEIALIKPAETSEHYRAAINDSLVMVRHIVDTSIFLREMADAECPGTAVKKDLGGVLLHLLEEMAPLLESSGVRLRMEWMDEIVCHVDSAKLEKALFLLVDQMRSEVTSPTDLQVACRRGPSHAEIELNLSAEVLRAQPGAREHRSIELASAMVRGMGGALAIGGESAGNTRVEISLPLN